MAIHISSTYFASPLWLRAGSIALAVLLGCTSLHAQQTQHMTGAAPANFAIRGFNIKGDNPLSQNDTSRILAAFLRSDATIEVLQKATAALETALRDAGFGLHRVSLPPQTMSDTVTLEIVNFTIGSITLDGNKLYSSANIRASIPELQEGGAPNFNRLAVQTSIANENPGKQISISLRESTLADKIDATVQVKEAKPWNLSVALANSGSAASGRDRTTFSGGFNNVFGLDHQLAAAYTTSLQRAQDVKQVGLSYRMPLYRVNSVVALNFTQSDVLGNFGAFTSTGQGRTLGANYSYHFSPEGGRRSYFNLGLDDKLFKAALINGTAVGADRRTRPLSLGYTVRSESDAGSWSYNLDGAVNMRSGAANNLTAYQAEDTRIATHAFRVFHAGASYGSGFGKNWSWSLRSQVQNSNNALLSGEQFGLGGVTSVRGAADRVITGDKGLSTSLEVTSPELMAGLRASTFVDGGWVQNNRVDGTNKLARDKLASAGLGLRYTLQNGLNLNADYGRIITGSALPLSVNSNAPQKGSEKLHVNLSVRF